MAQLASNLYLSVHALPQEDHYDTDDASAAEISPLLMSASTVYVLQSSRRRAYRASVVARHAPTHRTATLHGRRSRVLRTRGHPMARSKLPEDTVLRLVQCQRWGVCDAGTADLCAVDLKTVYRFQHVAAPRAATPHDQVVRAVEVPGGQLAAAHAKRRPRQVAWIHTALAMGSWFLLWVDIGPRTQEPAAPWIAQVVARVRAVPLLLTDGWKA